MKEEEKEEVELTPGDKFVSWFAWVASAAIVVYIFNTL